MPKPRKPLAIDYANTDPFRGLPPHYPMRHSRFALEPSDEAARIEASEPTTDKRRIKAVMAQVKPSPAAQEAWEDILARVAAARKRSRKR